MEELIVLSVIIVFVSAFLIWTTLMQRKGIKGQKIAIDAQAEAIERQKKAIEQVEESIAISREQVEGQKQIISLLQEIKEELKIKS